jgi:hypothetical protein
MKRVPYLLAWTLAVGVFAICQQNTVSNTSGNTFRAETSTTSPVSTAIVPGSKVYIEKMNGFENYLAAAFAKKKVRLVIVADEGAADYVLGGVSDEKKAGWAKIVFMGDIHSDNQASVTMIDRKTSAIVFAYAVNKKNTVHGDQTTAEACAKHLEARIEGR